MRGVRLPKTLRLMTNKRRVDFQQPRRPRCWDGRVEALGNAGDGFSSLSGFMITTMTTANAPPIGTGVLQEAVEPA
jgi:hypothetical protein